MSLKLEWEMNIAVISTAHHPQEWKPDHWIFHFKTDDPKDGVIVYIQDLEEDKPEWLRTLAGLLEDEGCGWIRFLPDGPVIEGLPTFEWD